MPRRRMRNWSIILRLPRSLRGFVLRMCAAIGHLKSVLSELVGSKLKSLVREGSAAMFLSSNSGESCMGQPIALALAIMSIGRSRGGKANIHQMANVRSIAHLADQTRFLGYLRRR